MTQTELKVVRHLKENNFDKDVAIISILALKHDEKLVSEFYDWLISNKNIKTEDIYEKIVEITPKQEISIED